MPTIHALEPLRSTAALQVRQIKEWGEILTGWETKNRYEVKNAEGDLLWTAGEMRSGLFGLLLRNVLDNRRPFRIELRTLAGAVALSLVRPWRWFFSTLEVFDAAGTRLGTIQQRFAFFARRFEVLNAQEAVIAEIHGPFFKPWTFRVEVNGADVGAIVKKWSGFGRELFSDSDNFGVSFTPQADRVAMLKPLALAATFLIDFLYFENRK